MKRLEGYLFLHDDPHPTHKVNPDGVEYEDFMKKPDVLLNHNWEQPPIGKVIEVVNDEKGLKVIMEVQDLFADMAESLLLDPGFIPITFEIKGDVTHHEKVRLIDVSAVINPAGEREDHGERQTPSEEE